MHRAQSWRTCSAPDRSTIPRLPSTITRTHARAEEPATPRFLRIAPNAVSLLVQHPIACARLPRTGLAGQLEPARPRYRRHRLAAEHLIVAEALARAG